MQIYTASDAGAQLQNLMSRVITEHEPIYIGENDTQVVILSADDYRSLQETLYLMSVPGMRQSILQGREESIDNCSTQLPW